MSETPARSTPADIVTATLSGGFSVCTWLSALVVATLLTTQAKAAEPAPDSISVYFDVGSSSIKSDSLAELDHAARLYRDGKPILMTVSAGTDSTGSPQANIRLSQLRANAVFRGLVARGIPADRFQILAKGVTDPAVPDNPQDSHNRRAQITWK